MNDIVSVIIPAFNAEATMACCLRALEEQTQSPDEIIVVDDGSVDETARIARQFDVVVISQHNSGAGAARNRGVAAAQGDLLLFTDSDCAPAPEWVECMVAAFTPPEIAGAKGVYRTRQRELVARFVQLEYEDRYDRMSGCSTIDFIDTYSAAYRSAVFESSAGFDVSLRMNQDQEFSFRLTEAGHHLVFVPAASVYHIHDRTLKEYIHRKFWIGYWKVQVLRAHPAKMIRDSHTPQVLKLQLGLAGLGGVFIAGGLLTNWLFWVGLAAWGGLLLSGIPFLGKVWRRDRKVLIVAPLLLFVRAWALGWGMLLGSVRWLQ